ncbi:hypothetical protein B0T22DRAFT_441636 [Podospora appendiculata]|uniref:Ubiquitin 3 binding protein But2 C-terminal domain-containing protein n=1 Tax=Podospora appendiculata TaxID=314037 RepID=A0AAE0XCV0_9PEZI|nr:hypothetical protein B0T22DRAFT_441636 [Podospora appendiculata]
MLPKTIQTALGLASLLATTTHAAAIEATPTATPTPDPDPTWTPLTMALPHPYQSPSLSLSTDGAQTTAVLALGSPNPCGGRTEFASTKTINLPVDCEGALLLSVSIRRGTCPLGGVHQMPAIVDTVSSTPSTVFGFTCGPTPAPAHTVSYNLADVTHTLPLPTLRPGQTPPEVPTALSAVHYPGGECRVWLGLAAADGSGSREKWISSVCEASRVSPRAYAATVTSTIGVECDGCKYVRGGDLWYSCARSYSSLSAGVTVQVRTATTKWVYDCEEARATGH